jgi:hypothetical protein
VSFAFEKDYLQDLDSVLAKLEAEGHQDAVAGIANCKTIGATGGEILSCINHALRQTRNGGVSKELEQLIDTYLRKAPGY